MVPWARKSTSSPTLRASSSNTRMNSAPMILRFFSGSSTPASRSRKRSVASTYTRLASIWFLNMSMTCSDSPLRMRPWFTCTHMRFSPMARSMSAATTELSTPPESASSTLPSPTWSRMACTCSSMKALASSGLLMRCMSVGRVFWSIGASFSAAHRGAGGTWQDAPRRLLTSRFDELIIPKGRLPTPPRRRQAQKPCA